MLVVRSLVRMSVCYFFFSSRRRHTRCLSDWSSDVCSSDLLTDVPRTSMPDPSQQLTQQATMTRKNLQSVHRHDHQEQDGQLWTKRNMTTCKNRSEERRVGKSVDRGGSRSKKKKKITKQRNR